MAITVRHPYGAACRLGDACGLACRHRHLRCSQSPAPIGDAALPAPYFSMWQTSDPDPQNARHVLVNHFYLAPTLSRSLDSAATEEVHFLRDEMANVAWAIERSIESPIERAAQRYEAADAAVADLPPTVTPSTLPRYLLSSTVPPNWIPLLPVQPTESDPKQSLLRRGKVLQPDGSGTLHQAKGELLTTPANLLIYDEEVPREGVRITRQRRAARWTDGSTWVWTSLATRSAAARVRAHCNSTRSRIRSHPPCSPAFNELNNVKHTIDQSRNAFL